MKTAPRFYVTRVFNDKPEIVSHNAKAWFCTLEWEQFARLMQSVGVHPDDILDFGDTNSLLGDGATYGGITGFAMDALEQVFAKARKYDEIAAIVERE